MLYKRTIREAYGLFFQGRRMFECVPSIIGKIVLTIGT